MQCWCDRAALVRSQAGLNHKLQAPHASPRAAYPAATAEAWADGHVHAFAFFGKVPASVLFDNDRCLVAKILPDGTRQRATLFSGFVSLYLFRDRYGRPGKGNDKGSAEGLVGYSRRNFMVPIQRFASWDVFNGDLEEQSRQRQADVLPGQSETIGERLVRDLDAMAELPAAPFDACDQATGRVSSQAKVRGNLATAQAAGERNANRFSVKLRGWFLCHDASPLWQNTKSKERNNSVTGPNRPKEDLFAVTENSIEWAGRVLR